MTITDRIEINAKVMMGKPVIRGTRIPVELILRKLGEGATEQDLLDAYPRLTRADIQAAIGYAADTVAHEETVLVGPAPSRKRTKRWKPKEAAQRILLERECRHFTDPEKDVRNLFPPSPRVR